MPFPSLDLPDWALMTREELDELSDSDSESSIDESEDEQFADSEAVDVMSDDTDADIVVSTACASPVQAACFGPLLRNDQRWADLVDSDEEEDTCANVHSTVLMPRRWADIVDTDINDSTWVEHLPEFRCAVSCLD